MADQDIVQRLLEVERQAEDLVKEAEKEAETRKNAVREAEGRRFQEETARRNREQEERFQRTVESFKKERERKLSEYVDSLKASAVNVERFTKKLDEIIEKGIV